MEYQPRRLLKWLVNSIELSYAILSLVLLTGAFVPLLGITSGDQLEGAPAARLMYATIYLVAASRMLVAPRRLVPFLASGSVPIALAVLALLSSAWADLPILSLRRGLALLGTTAFGVYLAMRFSIEQLLRLAGWALLLILIGSVATIAFLPTVGTMQGYYSGAWQGVFVHKNSLGRYMALGFLVFMLLTLDRTRRSFSRLLILPVFATALFFSKSITGLVVLLACIIVLPLLTTVTWRRSQRLGVYAILSGLLLGSSLIALAEAGKLVQLFGRDLTLTGRTELWRLTADAVSQRFWLGYGYKNFWDDWGGQANYIRATLSWDIPHAHNGVLELLLSLGFVGLAFLVASLWQTTANAIWYARAYPHPLGYWPLCLLVFMILANTTESVFVNPNDFYWTLYVATSISLNRVRLRSEAGQPINQYGSQRKPANARRSSL